MISKTKRSNTETPNVEEVDRVVSKFFSMMRCDQRLNWEGEGSIMMILLLSF